MLRSLEEPHPDSITIGTPALGALYPMLETGSRFKPQPLQVPPSKPDRQICRHH
ncbi:hypothetical protein SynRCC2555_01290 [Synechococcus sp. WH 8101]|nr:hypothetical protein SynRCC2555_01290 [Synechococcus sp. WH 8101]